MLLALPELNTLRGARIVSRRAASQAWSEFLLDYNWQDEGREISPDALRKFLVQTDEFRGGGRPLPRGRTGNWFSQFQNPSETFARLVDVFGDVRFRGADGSEWSFRDVFQFTVRDELVPPGGPRAACRPTTGDRTRNGVFICAQPNNVPRAGAIDGTWLLETPTIAVRTRESVCGRCGSIHAFSNETRFVGLPPVLAVDFGACLPMLGKRRTVRFDPVHAPLRISVPLGADGLRADYELASFVELKDSQCIAYVRIGPNSFVAYDDGCTSGQHFLSLPSRSPASSRWRSTGHEGMCGSPV